MLKAIVEADSTCSGCQGRFPALLPTAWVPSGRGILCPTCSQTALNPEDDSRFRQFWEIVRQERNVNPIEYLQPEIEDEIDTTTFSKPTDAQTAAAWQLLHDKLAEELKAAEQSWDSHTTTTEDLLEDIEDECP